MKKIILAAAILFILLNNISFASTDPKEEIQDYLQKQINSIDIYKFDQYINDNKALKSVNLKYFIMDVLSGKKNILDLFDKDKLINLFTAELKNNMNIFISILILSFLSSILKNLDNSFSNSAISQISNYVIFIVIISLSFIIFKDILEVTKSAIDNMVSFMEIIIPIEIAFLLTLGLPIASSILSPILLGVVVFINIVFKNFLFLVITFAFSILIINTISKNLKLKRLFGFSKQLATFSISALFTVFLAIISIQGIYVTSFDKFSVKALKFMLGNFIPVIGGFVSDSLDIILSSSHLLKSVVGSVGLVILLSICLIPIIKILLVMVMYKALSIIIEPISDESISSYLNQLANLMITMLISVTVIGVIFFITISLLASIGSVSRL